MKKRARRRLVGASALALLAVIVLPMVMDQEPRPESQDIQIRIPSQEPGAHNVASRIVVADEPAPPQHPPAEAEPTIAIAPGGTGPAAAATKTPAKAEPEPAPAPSAPQTEAKKADAPAARQTAQAAERARAMALLNEEQWIIQLGAYQNQSTVRSLQAKLKELGYPSYTEAIDTPKGQSTRVRCGPFPSREAAEKAHARLKKIAAGGPGGGTIAQLK
ncbi:hypothetical protein ACY05_01630 [Sterolibacterium denitrificans]|uniref:SPOR domain-containing protein n=1 Tax=Sterolibacterium denitrificans TaxID=157592 RepID=A0A656ZCY9_9PROT|nr:hypothetical protein ACY05_01630 [Sterolibacterium denitrificans]